MSRGCVCSCRGGPAASASGGERSRSRRTLDRLARLWTAVRRSYIFFVISWNFITKKRRFSRQLILKTSVASVLVAMCMFLAAYSAVLLLASPAELNLLENEEGAGMSEPREEVGRRGRLLWSYRPRSRLHSRYSEDNTGASKGKNTEGGAGMKTPPSSDWGYTRLVNNITVRPSCSTYESGKSLILTILITSAPANRKKRELIRKTWCSHHAAHPKANYDIEKDDLEKDNFERDNLEKPSVTESAEPERKWRCVFLLGETADSAQNLAIREEATEQGDMLVGRYSDSYRNLTYKVISGLHWAVNKDSWAVCGRPRFILKTDDDCFVNTQVLAPVLAYQARTAPPQRVAGMYVGNVFIDTDELQVIRDPNSKWAVSREDYAPDLYPQYASGTGYVLSVDAVRKVLHAAQTYMPFPNEDAYVGVLAESVGISPVHSHRFTHVSSQWTTCNFLYLLVIHHVSLRQQTHYLQMSLRAKTECANQPFYGTWR